MTQTQALIEDVLRHQIGLNPLSLGSHTIARLVHQRMAACKITDFASYALKLQTSVTELKALIEAIVVPETWFFRDREPFAFLGRYAQTEWLGKRPNRVLRVLSLPCSTGEEPYSVAIALLEAGLAPHQFKIDAIDISQKSLSKAKQGLYDAYSFRGFESVVLQRHSASDDRLTLRDRYFQTTPEGYELLTSVRELVTFTQGNVLDADFLIGKPLYDIIFCRNLLIYLDQPARQHTIQVLDRLLQVNGLLFTGHSEISQLSTAQFKPLRPAAAFVSRKQPSPINSENPSSTQHPATQTIPAPKTSFRHQLRSDRALSQPTTNHQLTETSSATQSVTPPVSLETQNVSGSLLVAAQSCADQGQLERAITLCEAYLHENRVDPEGYLLLGQIYQATGNEPKAEQCFHKVIYLHPHHEDALMHLILLKEQRGEVSGTEILKQRLYRLQQSHKMGL